ncbi:polysaccharide lyase family 1 protein [Burkholderia cepacia]|uniref:polysaccharide lyase family 1 protein n=1 Tax=Burkholderia cepacia TaxID=292 RepID=UPI000AF03D03|nr:polysaccharide lyase family 1 protein [Burkholderia cepacia]
MPKNGVWLAILMLIGPGHSALAYDLTAQHAPDGFGIGTSGGAGGEVVRVSTATQLKFELCRTVNREGFCSDNLPRVIEVSGEIDYTGSEGTASKPGCDYGLACTAPYKTESLVLLNENDHHCDGKAIKEVTFDVAGDRPLVVGSNKTVLGIGARSGIKGKGLVLRGVKNVIVRNLTISNINQGKIFAGDGVTLDDVEQVWIDHNRFNNIGRQMIVSGFGPAKGVSISWNDFDGTSVYSHTCNGTHYWNLLLAGKIQSITLNNNWFRNFSGRAPKVGGDSSLIHLVNNFFQNGSWHALDAVKPAKILVEGNYFDNVKIPITVTSDPGYIFGQLQPKGELESNQCRAVFGRDCASNIATPKPSVNGFDANRLVLDAFGSVPRSQVVSPKDPSRIPEMVKEGVGPGRIPGI